MSDNVNLSLVVCHIFSELKANILGVGDVEIFLQSTLHLRASSPPPLIETCKDLNSYQVWSDVKLEVFSFGSV